MIWAAISCYSAGPIMTLHCPVTASDYVGISRNHVRTMVQMFRKNYTILHIENSPMRNMKMHFNIFPGQHNCQT